ncbi:MAG TPA: hypothetical protein VFH39_05180, partial [Candidatus Saccharimonadales bacterium]|nr:hypothetical protein [Candidatus Saccharimonadales bacterium]
IEEEAKAMAGSPLLTTDEFEDAIREVFPFDESTLDRLFDTEADKFEPVLVTAAKELYDARTEAFTPEIMHKIEHDIYLQVLDELWMQHLENMDHLREGIHWMSVGQQDPLVEYRRRGQQLFDAMQQDLRHTVLRTLFHAQPIDMSMLEQPIETELTRAARGSISNAGQINNDQEQFDETSFVPKKTETQVKKQVATKRKATRKTERKRKTTARRRK